MDNPDKDKAEKVEKSKIRFAKRQSGSWQEQTNKAKAAKQSKPEGKLTGRGASYKKEKNFEVLYKIRDDIPLSGLFSSLRKLNPNWKHYKWFPDESKAQDCVRVHMSRAERGSGIDKYYQYIIKDKDGKEIPAKNNY